MLGVCNSSLKLCSKNIMAVSSLHSTNLQTKFPGESKSLDYFSQTGDTFHPSHSAFSNVSITKSHDGVFGRRLHSVLILSVSSITMFVNIGLCGMLTDCLGYMFSSSLTIRRDFLPGNTAPSGECSSAR